MSDIVDELRRGYATFGIALETQVAWGDYYRLCCARCGATVGSVGDKLFPGMVGDLLNEQFDLYAANLLGCNCGYQAEKARALDPARAQAARTELA